MSAHAQRTTHCEGNFTARHPPFVRSRSAPPFYGRKRWLLSLFASSVSCREHTALSRRVERCTRRVRRFGLSFRRTPRSSPNEGARTIRSSEPARFEAVVLRCARKMERALAVNAEVSAGARVFTLLGGSGRMDIAERAIAANAERMIREIVGAHVAVHVLLGKPEDRIHLVHVALALHRAEAGAERRLSSSQAGDPRRRLELLERALHRLDLVQVVIKVERALVAFPELAVERFLARRRDARRVHAHVELEPLREL